MPGRNTCVKRKNPFTSKTNVLLMVANSHPLRSLSWNQPPSLLFSKPTPHPHPPPWPITRYNDDVNNPSLLDPRTNTVTECDQGNNENKVKILMISYNKFYQWYHRINLRQYLSEHFQIFSFLPIPSLTSSKFSFSLRALSPPVCDQNPCFFFLEQLMLHFYSAITPRRCYNS
jgi:hypothetical protein